MGFDREASKEKPAILLFVSEALGILFCFLYMGSIAPSKAMVFEISLHCEVCPVVFILPVVLGNPASILILHKEHC